MPVLSTSNISYLCSIKHLVYLSVLVLKVGLFNPSFCVSFFQHLRLCNPDCLWFTKFLHGFLIHPLFYQSIVLMLFLCFLLIVYHLIYKVLFHLLLLKHNRVLLEFQFQIVHLSHDVSTLIFFVFYLLLFSLVEQIFVLNIKCIFHLFCLLLFQSLLLILNYLIKSNITQENIFVIFTLGLHFHYLFFVAHEGLTQRLFNIFRLRAMSIMLWFSAQRSQVFGIQWELLSEALTYNSSGCVVINLWT